MKASDVMTIGRRRGSLRCKSCDESVVAGMRTAAKPKRARR
jgi:hypothetical protein